MFTLPNNKKKIRKWPSDIAIDSDKHLLTTM